MADSWGSEWKWETDTLSQGYKRGRQAIHRDIQAPAQTLAHIKEFTHLLPIPYPVFSIRPRPPASTSQRPCSSNGLTQPQSFLSEAQLRSPAPLKTESIQSWPLEPPLEAWRTDRAKGPTCYQLPPLPPALPGQSLPHDRHFICRDRLLSHAENIPVSSLPQPRCPLHLHLPHIMPSVIQQWT